MKIETAKLGRMELHELIGAAISPLPVAFISTIGEGGKYNAAPFSFVAPMGSKPAIVCVAFGLRKGQKKDTLKNIEMTRDFVINVVDEPLIAQAVQASADYPYGVDEIKEVGLTAITSDMVKSPRIAESKISLECRLVQKLEILQDFQDGKGLTAIVFGEVVMAHVKDELWLENRIDPTKFKPVGRVGKDLYCRTEDVFEIRRPEL